MIKDYTNSLISAFLIVIFSTHIACQIAVKHVADNVAMEGRHYTAILHTIQCSTCTSPEHYANHSVNSQHSGLAWKPAIAAMPLTTTRNAISEAVNILSKCENKVQRHRRCQSFTYSLTSHVQLPRA